MHLGSQQRPDESTQRDEKKKREEKKEYIYT
jgi:hypothetical protein